MTLDIGHGSGDGTDTGFVNGTGGVIDYGRGRTNGSPARQSREV